MAAATAIDAANTAHATAEIAAAATAAAATGTSNEQQQAAANAAALVTANRDMAIAETTAREAAAAAEAAATLAGTATISARQAAAAVRAARQEETSRTLDLLQQEDNNRGNTLRPIDLPKPPPYDGSGDVNMLDLWLFQVENYLRIGGIRRVDLQLYIAGGLLQGPALTWYQAAQQTNSAENRVTDWASFRQGLTDNFGPVNLNMTARNKIAECVQTSSIRDYLTRFRSLAVVIQDMTAAEQFDKFTRGLKPAIRKELIMREVATFAEAARLAEKFESLHTSAGGSTAPPKPIQRAPLRANAIGERPPAPAAPANHENRPRREKLTQAIKDDLILRGACFYCREEGHSIANCPTKPPQPAQQLND